MGKNLTVLLGVLFLFSSVTGWAGKGEPKVLQPKVPGYKIGSVILKGNVDLYEKYNTNIYTQNTGPVGDFITVLSPGVAVEAVDTPHKFLAHTGVSQNWYARHGRDAFTDCSAGAKGRYNFNGDMFWDGTAGYRHLHSARGDNQADPTDTAAKPIPYDITNAETAFYKRWGKVTLRPHGGLLAYNYHSVARLNGGRVDEDYRDRVGYVLGTSLGYDLPHKWKLFTELDGNTKKYRKDDGTGRSSHGGSVLAGLEYKPGPQLYGRIGGGYIRQLWKHSDIYRSVGTWNALARLDWQYSEKGKMRGLIRRFVDEVTDAGASCYVRTDVTLSLDQQLYTDLMGTVSWRYSRYEFQGGFGATGGLSDRRDQLNEGKIGLVYKLTDVVSFVTDFTYTLNRSNRISSSYKRGVLLTGFKVGFYD